MDRRRGTDDFVFFRVPPPGYAIGVLAAVAGIMSVREVKTAARIAWVCLLVLLMLAEFRAIKHDREEAAAGQKKFFDSQRAGFANVTQQAAKNFQEVATSLSSSIAELQKLLATTQQVALNVTGGESFAYVYPDVNSRDHGFQLKIHNDGDQPLTGVTFKVFRVVYGSLDPRTPSPSDPTRPAAQLALVKTYSVETLAPHAGEIVPDSAMFVQLDSNDRAYYHLTISAQNFEPGEELYFRPSINRKGLAYKFDLWRTVTGKKRSSDFLSHNAWWRLLKTQDWTEPIADPAE